MVSKALEDTVVTEDKKSGVIGSLSMLHSLLVQYIEEDLESCDTFVFAPGHGCLATVPFAALYDDRKHEFLIARKCVATATIYSRGSRDGGIIFHVKPCLGKEMTKKAILEGLSNSGVVLLATHGTDVETKRMKAEDADQVLTAAEIATLENGISAELVVLSACESGLGQATASEGLLGLGRALPQAGAATAILTLWKVDDLMTSRFGAAPVTHRPVIAIQIERWIVSCGAGLFHELLIATPKGRNVSECLRMVMLQMIQDNVPVRHWAPFTIVGIPAVRLFVPNDNWEVSGLDKFSHVLFPSNDTCQFPCRVCEELQLEKLHIILHPEDRLVVCRQQCCSLG
ncbi:unnamed protein product [Sphagnum jensenii]